MNNGTVQIGRNGKKICGNYLGSLTRFHQKAGGTAGKEFGWKRTTTYTMLKRLCERGIFENNGGTVATVIEKDDFIYRQSQDFIDRTFQGSLPMFLTLFSKNKGLSDDEIAEIQQLIDRYKEGGR